MSTTLSRAAICAKEVWLTLADVCETVKCVLVAAVEPSNERLGILDLSPFAIHHTITLLAVAIVEIRTNALPLAIVPETALHLTTLGHLQAVERVAVTAEESSNKVVLAAEFATLEIELLPPILMVAVLKAESPLC